MYVHGSWCIEHTVLYTLYVQGSWSALMAAVYKGHEAIALRIIEAGATPHLQDKVRGVV